MSAKWDLQNEYLISVLRLMGLWPKDTYKFDLYTIYSAIVFTIFIVVPNLVQALEIFFVDELSQATAILFLLLSIIGVMMKFYVIFTNMKAIKCLINDINKEVFLPKNQLQEHHRKSSLKVWKRLYVLYNALGVSTALLWTLSPILNGTYKEYVLPFLAWYPFDPKRPLLYELIYFHQSFGVTYLAIINVNVDSLISALMMFVGIQCDILCDNLRKLHEKNNVSEGFLECIEHHKEILRFAQYTNKVFDFVIFIQFFVSSVSLGVNMFQLSLIRVFTSEFNANLSYEGALTMQIIMYSWFGNEVLFKSSKIPTAAYEFDWADQPELLKKEVVFFIQRTQKPIVFKAVDLFHLSLETFIRIMRTAWSYFAVLRNLSSV